MIVEGEVARILLPGEPGYEDARTRPGRCCASITWVTALISARCVKACG